MLESIQKIHFIGIGGIGMSAIADILLDKGYKIFGSDAKLSLLTEKLAEKGATIFKGHSKDNILNYDIVVRSSAITDDNPEIIAAKEKNIPIYHRSDLLAELLNGNKAITVAGSHGKTTTSSMISVIFDYNKMNPTVIVGGFVDYFNGNAKLGKSDFVIAEADESDGSFLKFKPYIGVITNIEDDHMDYYGSMDNLMNAFKEYVDNISPNGKAILCIDHIKVEKLAKEITKPYISYSIEKDSDYVAKNIKISKDKTLFDVYFHNDFLGTVQLLIPGKHNVLNALGAFCVAHFVGIKPEKIIEALKIFHGANRRFQTKLKTDDYWIVDDYAHHPTEIKMTLKAASQTNPKRLICVFQPHRYTRTKLLAKEFGSAFKDADIVILTDIYSAGEKPLSNVDGYTIVNSVKENGQEVVYLPKKEDIVPYLKNILQKDDMIITMGAGDIYTCGEKLANIIKD